MPGHPAAASYLELVDAALPGRLEGLYLEGSVALGDYRPGASDVDVVAVTATPLTDAEVAVLRTVHSRLPRRPHLDGSYVTWQDLRGDPATAAAGATAHEGRLHRRAHGCGDVVAWHTLAAHGIAVRGPAPADIPVWTDPQALRAFSRRNLEDYWRPWLRRARVLPTPLGLACLTGWGPVWGVLGVSRVHHAAVTGTVTSKTGAGAYARATFDDRWHPVLDECLTLRGGGRGRMGRAARRRTALDFMAMVLADATGWPAPPSSRPTRP